ncbi:pilus assembly protein FimV [Duganella sp. FT3S]|uniref:Pilus assembly protein FimV n=1 Tax=Rugamonas fusca TaxID=2758568 RepID=A0A7W2EL32_9BURK|nr:FimV/HubP family polar landmark protein [Rugamonas fusca]MBA5607883.1 pilus assembly protein FimV [Rugamonas fusca]
MHLTTRPRIVSFALKTLTSAVACAVLLSPAANAAGLGKLTVLSSLGQPLRAEIELTAVSADEAGALVAKLAPPDAFRAANIDFNPTLLSLRFEVQQRDGRQVIRITSGQPVNEPFVDMLLELNWNGGRLVREYTFLLDPAELRATQPAQVAAPARPATPAVQPPAPVAAQPAAPSARAPAPEGEKSRQGASQYQVKAGDNLTRIAGQLKPVDVSLDQMLVALYRANPEAFAGKNMNRLKAGRILAVPDADSVRATATEGEARGVVVAHAADFNAYRSKLAGQVATSAPAKEPEATQSVAGKITAKVEERATPVNEAKDQLKLSKASPASAPAGGKTAMAVEDKIAKEKQVADAASRVKELEKNVSDLENLMAVKNKALADQKKASASASAAASAPVIDLDASAKASASASAPASAAASVPPKPRRTVVVPPRIAEPSIADIVMDNITYIGAGLAALLGGVGLLVARRRRQEQAAAEVRTETSVLGDSPTTGQQLIAETGGQSVDTNNSVFNSNFAPSASQLDTNEVDPVAEADVYIAYGRDAQAEEILKEALRMHPERHAVRLKLLEIYATRKDMRAFETQASELYSQTGGEGDDWAQAVVLGKALDPNNPLYASGKQPAAAPAPAPAAAPLNDFDPSMFAPPPAEVASSFAAPAAGGLDLDLSQDAAPAPAAVDFGTDHALETAVPSDAPTPAAMAAAAPADQFLDFDLGGLNFDAPAAPAPAAPAEAAPAKAEEAVFDLNFDAAPPAPAAAPAPAPAPADDFSMDFGLDLPATPAAAAAPAPAPAPAPLPVVDSDPLADLNLMDFDIPAVPAPAPAAELSASDFALPEIAAAAPAPAPADVAAPEFDLSSIDLDLNNAAVETKPARAEPQSAVHMEMETKLDLAIAYQEIGDKEGARELLDEVIRGGSDEQVAKATSMRALLS